MDDMERNRTALVTGGVRGIGLAVASALASRRMRVALAYVGSPEDTVQAAVERVDAARPDRKEPLDGRTWAMRADVSDEDQVKAMIEETLHRGDGLDVLVANAGIVKDNLSAFMTADDFRSVLEVNLTGAFLCAREAARVMMRQRSGGLSSCRPWRASMATSARPTTPRVRRGWWGWPRAWRRSWGPGASR